MGDWLEAHFYLSAFLRLSTTRQFGAMGGIYSIPWDKVMYYADRLGLDPEAAHNLWLVIQAVDAKYVKDVNKKHEPPKKGPSGSARNPLPRVTRQAR